MKKELALQLVALSLAAIVTSANVALASRQKRPPSELDELEIELKERGELSGSFGSETVTPGVGEYWLIYPVNVKGLRVAILWDYVGNDLDLYLYDPDDNLAAWFVKAWSITEELDVDNPATGWWKAVVYPYSLETSSQDYYIAVSITT